jgi:hypothetical protein
MFAAARLDDADAMARFLSDIPNRDDLARVLQERKPVASRAYDDDSWTARFVASDGCVVKCFAVTEITIDQAEMIAAACQHLSAWDENEFRQAVVESLGSMIDPAD